jgi:hypothetical protein
MAGGARTIDVYLEAGRKRTFASALDWPGWCRSGADEEAALRALVDYGPRYASVVRPRRLGFAAPGDVDGLRVAQRIRGDASTEFGVPGAIPKADRGRIGKAEAGRAARILEACWAALDAAGGSVRGPLATGPRGGGRTLAKIQAHVAEAEGAYLRALGLPEDVVAGGEGREAILFALAAMADRDPVLKGPRGGARWPARYFVRRAAWHVLDHAWEIEDRSVGS